MHNGRVIADPEAIAEGFNNCFVNIGPTLAYKVPNNDVSHILRTHSWNRDKEYY